MSESRPTAIKDPRIRILSPLSLRLWRSEPPFQNRSFPGSSSDTQAKGDFGYHVAFAPGHSQSELDAKREHSRSSVISTTEHGIFSETPAEQELGVKSVELKA